MSGLSPSGNLHDPCQAHHYRVVDSNERKVPSTISKIGNKMRHSIVANRDDSDLLIFLSFENDATDTE